MFFLIVSPALSSTIVTARKSTAGFKRTSSAPKTVEKKLCEVVTTSQPRLWTAASKANASMKMCTEDISSELSDDQDVRMTMTDLRKYQNT